MSALISRSIDLDDLRPAEHRFSVAALVAFLLALGPASAVLMLLAQA
jgi:hypothetical protein